MEGGGKPQNLDIVQILPRWVAEFCELTRGTWQNFPWKTVGPTNNYKHKPVSNVAW